VKNMQGLSKQMTTHNSATLNVHMVIGRRFAFWTKT